MRRPGWLVRMLLGGCCLLSLSGCTLLFGHNVCYPTYAPSGLGGALRSVAVQFLLPASGLVESGYDTPETADSSKKGRWTRTNLGVHEGQDVNFTVSGQIYMCPSLGVSYEAGEKAALQATGALLVDTTHTPPQEQYRGKFFKVDGKTSTSGNPVKTGYTVQPGSAIYITVGNPGEDFGSKNEILIGGNGNAPRTCGEQLIVQIGSTKHILSSDKSTLKRTTADTSGGSGTTPVYNLFGEEQYGYFEPFSTDSGLLSLGFEDNPYDDNSGDYGVYVQVYGCVATDGQPYIEDPPLGSVELVIANQDLNAPGATLPDVESVDNMHFTASKTGTVWMRVKDKDQAAYGDNSGQYDVTLFTQEAQGARVLSTIFNHIFSLVKDTLDDVTKTFFEQFTQDGHFGSYITSLLTLYIIFYGIMFLFGMVPMSQLDFVIRIIKVALVAGLMGQDSWTFFHDIFLRVLIDGSMFLMEALTGDMSTSDNPFGFLDSTLGMYLNIGLWYGVLSLLGLGLVGIVYIVLLCKAIYYLFSGVLEGFMGFLMALIILSMLIGMFPLFLSFFLFAKTRYLFDNWVRFSIRYTLEPALLMGGFVMLNTMMAVATRDIFSFSVCWKCAFPISLGIPDLGIMCLEFFVPWGGDYNQQGPASSQYAVHFSTIIIYLFFGALIKSWVNTCPGLVNILTGTNPQTAQGLTGGGPRGSAAGDAVTSLRDGLMGLGHRLLDRKDAATEQSRQLGGGPGVLGGARDAINVVPTAGEGTAAPAPSSAPPPSSGPPITPQAQQAAAAQLRDDMKEHIKGNQPMKHVSSDVLKSDPEYKEKVLTQLDTAPDALVRSANASSVDLSRLAPQEKAEIIRNGLSSDTELKGVMTAIYGRQEAADALVAEMQKYAKGEDVSIGKVAGKSFDEPYKGKGYMEGLPSDQLKVDGNLRENTLKTLEHKSTEIRELAIERKVDLTKLTAEQKHDIFSHAFSDLGGAMDRVRPDATATPSSPSSAPDSGREGA